MYNRRGFFSKLSSVFERQGDAVFFGLQCVGLLICAAFPDLVTYLPRLMASR